MIHLRCEKCGFEWGYKGEKKVNAMCPDCGLRVSIPKSNVENDETPMDN